MALDFALSEEQQAIRQTTRDLFAPFAKDAARWRERILENKEFPQEIWDALAGAGFLGCLIPESYGGNEMGLLPLAFAVEEMTTLGFANPILVLTTMDALCMVRTASEETKQHFLPRIATGELKLAFALTEADAGTNTFRITTSAREEDDGFVLDGSKTFITGADVADAMLVVARTMSRKECEAQGLPKSYGLSLFIVPTDAPGLRKDLLPTGGIEGMNQWTLFFEDVKVPRINLVGDLHGGAMALFMALNPERILASAIAVGASEYALRLACDYARNRKVFRDTPIGAHQAIQHPLAEVKIRQEAARTMTYKAAWALDAGLPPGEAGFYANCAKFLASELGVQATDRAIQTLGGNGFSKEFGLLHLWTNLRLLKTAPISNEMILNYVAEHTLELPRSY
ncbi:MAG: acyl-CoA/acyl-ACP dehydrogenase [Deltaproteobacteria bacterium]|nr:acyl-CoA/acyl-ACP dehydrogenase [Deltaproteobacteria bacterium]